MAAAWRCHVRRATPTREKHFAGYRRHKWQPVAKRNDSQGGTMNVPSTHGDGSAPAGRGRLRVLLARRRWRVLVAATAVAIGLSIPAIALADNPSGCDFAASGTTQSCSGPLAGSTFAGDRKSTRLNSSHDQISY